MVLKPGTFLLPNPFQPGNVQQCVCSLPYSLHESCATLPVIQGLHKRPGSPGLPSNRGLCPAARGIKICPRWKRGDQTCPFATAA